DRATRSRAARSPRPPRPARNARHGSSFVLPAPEELRPMRAVQRFETVAEGPQLGIVLVGCPHAPEELEAAIDEIGVRDVGLAIGPDLGQATLPVGLPHLRAVHPELARKAAEPGEIVEAGARPWRVQREQVHQVEMPRVVPPEVIVPAELLPV